VDNFGVLGTETEGSGGRSASHCALDSAVGVDGTENDGRLPLSADARGVIPPLVLCWPKIERVGLSEVERDGRSACRRVEGRGSLSAAEVERAGLSEVEREGRSFLRVEGRGSLSTDERDVGCAGGMLGVEEEWSLRGVERVAAGSVGVAVAGAVAFSFCPSPFHAPIPPASRVSNGNFIEFPVEGSEPCHPLSSMNLYISLAISFW